MTDRLVGPRAKVERADEHIRELEASIKRFLDTDPYEVLREVNPDTGELAYRFRIRTQPPNRLPAIAGDAIHNLRSALDLLWCQLVEANGKKIAPSDLFVIKDRRRKFEAAFKGAKKRISGPARSVVAGLKPYKGGHDDLWRVHELDVIDKHRLLLALFASNEAIIVRIKSQAPWHTTPVTSPPIPLRPANRCLEDGSVLFSAPDVVEFEKFQEEPEFSVTIALHEPPIVECEPILPLLNQLRGAVNEVVELLAPFLTK